MNRITYGAMIVVLVSCTAMADDTAMGYWFIPRDAFAQLLQGSTTDSAAVEQSKLDNRATYRGRFIGRCDLWIQQRDSDLRIDVADDGKTVAYSIAVYWPTMKSAPPAIFKGRLAVGTDAVASHEGPNEELVLVFKRLDFKQDGTYDGEVSEGKADGQGTWAYPEGKKYLGGRRNVVT
ncbi:MAG: hypothetical protein WCS01_14520, partial [bacterium]